MSQAHDVPRTADVIIIGGGPAGTAACWAIERAAPGTKTVLLEQRGTLGAGSSTASLECFRSCWPTPCIGGQMARSLAVFRDPDAALGEGAAAALNVKWHGYLFCGFTPRQAAQLQREVMHLHEIGLEHVEFLTMDEVAYRFPWLGPHVIAAKFDPQAGSLDSNGMIHQFMRAAPSARAVLDVHDIAIRVESGRVTGVTTAQGNISAPIVVIAAGAGSRAVGLTADVGLPIVARARQSFTSGWRHDPFPPDAPLVIGAPTFPHVRPEAHTGAIFGWEYEGPDALREPVYPVEQLRDPRFPPATLALLARQFGHAAGEGFADSRYLQGIRHTTGYYVSRDESAAYTTAPDGTRTPYPSQRAIIDAHPAVAGLFLSVAHVGHGVMTAPAAGEILASHVLGHDLPNPRFADFGLDVAWVEHDENAL